MVRVSNDVLGSVGILGMLIFNTQAIPPPGMSVLSWEMMFYQVVVLIECRLKSCFIHISERRQMSVFELTRW